MTIYDFRDSNNTNDKINNTSSTGDTDKDNIIKLPTLLHRQDVPSIKPHVILSMGPNAINNM